VVRAIEIVERALRRYGPPVYVRHEIVHNRHVVDALRRKGAIFVEELAEIPAGAVTIFSAHGVPRSVQCEAEGRGLHIIDATCPLVSKVHSQGNRYAAQGREVLLIGYAGHPEVEGTTGRVDGKLHLIESEEDVLGLDIHPDTPVAYITQTTLSVDDTKGIIAALAARFNDLQGPETRDICYATQNRQRGVRDLCSMVDVLLVVGARNSSNSNRLREIGESTGTPSYLVGDSRDVAPEWLAGARAIGITAGASAPEALVSDVIDALAERCGQLEVSTMIGRVENIQFKLPEELAAV
jgi:4-hydroxy-3-methylbut-2-enyl diphosphate reductase